MILLFLNWNDSSIYSPALVTALAFAFFHGKVFSSSYGDTFFLYYLCLVCCKFWYSILIIPAHLFLISDSITALFYMTHLLMLYWLLTGFWLPHLTGNKLRSFHALFVSCTCILWSSSWFSDKRVIGTRETCLFSGLSTWWHLLCHNSMTFTFHSLYKVLLLYSGTFVLMSSQSCGVSTYWFQKYHFYLFLIG